MFCYIDRNCSLNKYKEKIKGNKCRNVSVNIWNCDSSENNKEMVRNCALCVNIGVVRAHNFQWFFVLLFLLSYTHLYFMALEQKCYMVCFCFALASPRKCDKKPKAKRKTSAQWQKNEHTIFFSFFFQLNAMKASVNWVNVLKINIFSFA